MSDESSKTSNMISLYLKSFIINSVLIPISLKGPKTRIEPVALPLSRESDQKLLIRKVEASVKERSKDIFLFLKSDSPLIVTIEGPIVNVIGLVINKFSF